jgi:hypothetical protein
MEEEVVLATGALTSSFLYCSMVTIRYTPSRFRRRRRTMGEHSTDPRRESNRRVATHGQLNHSSVHHSAGDPVRGSPKT